VDKARHDRELARVIVHVLKLCQEKTG
jgi:hypothetical protein